MYVVTHGNWTRLCRIVHAQKMCLLVDEYEFSSSSNGKKAFSSACQHSVCAVCALYLTCTQELILWNEGLLCQRGDVQIMVALIDDGRAVHVLVSFKKTFLRKYLVEMHASTGYYVGGHLI